MKIKSFLSTVVGAIIITTFSCTAAFSQEPGDEAVGDRKVSIGIGFPDSSEKFQGRIGLGIGLVPEYEGSGKYGVTALPLLDIGRLGAFFVRGASINPNDGLASAGVTVMHFSYSGQSGSGVQFVIGPLLRLHGGRDEDDSDELNGLGDIDPSAGTGGFIGFTAGSWQADTTISSQDVGNDKDGLLATFNLKHTTSVNEKLTVSTGLSTSWADEDYMQGYFGVTSDQAAQSGLPLFDSEAGFKDVGIQFHTSYALSKSLSLDSQLGFWRLLNDAANSPIVEDSGSANQIKGLIGISYGF